VTASSDIRRHSDGSIDFDHYRRTAARERQQAFRRAFHRWRDAFFKLVSVARSGRVFSFSHLRQRPVHARVNTDAFTNQPSR
jgi:hypothetical protein